MPGTPLPPDEPCWTRATTRRVAAHLRFLSQQVAEIEAGTCENLQDTDAPGDAVIQSLQRLDYLRQSLDDVASLLDAMHVGDDAQPARLAALKMGSTRALVQDEPPPQEKPASGSLDLF